MSSRKSSAFYGVLIALASLVVGMVIASHLGITPASIARPMDLPTANSAPISGPIDSTTFRSIAHDASPSVVSIRTRAKREVRGVADFFQFDNPFGGGRRQQPQRPPQQQILEGAGSGFIIDKNGFVLTNNHVVEDATEIEVQLATMRNGEPGLKAKLVGRDVLTDTALLQVTELPDHPLVAAKFGDSSQVAPGDWVMAIGNPFRLSTTVTVGVVSAVSRTAPELQPVQGRDLEMIQTDAAINRGNSGGPLLNLRGEVVGINTAIFSDQGGGNLGIGFSVPINTVRDILPQLHKGKVVRGRIRLSLSPYPVTREDIEDLGLPSTGGAVVSLVPEGGPASKAGIKISDAIVEFNGKTVTDNSQLVGMVTRTAPGTTVPLKVVRDKKTISLNVTVEELDVDAEQASLDRSRPDAPRQEREQPRETGFGMTIETITPEIARQLRLPPGKTGVVVTEIEPGSAAAQQGLRPGDVIVSVNGQAATSVDTVGALLDRVQVGRNARVVILRQGEESLVLMRKR
jgi:serine protease Do